MSKRRAEIYEIPSLSDQKMTMRVYSEHVKPNLKCNPLKWDYGDYSCVTSVQSLQIQTLKMPAVNVSEAGNTLYSYLLQALLIPTIWQRGAEHGLFIFAPV